MWEEKYGGNRRQEHEAFLCLVQICNAKGILFIYLNSSLHLICLRCDKFTRLLETPHKVQDILSTGCVSCYFLLTCNL